jgi:hypothetical protein
MIEVFSCGTEIDIIAPVPIPAIITGICIRENNNVSYEIQYFHNGENRCVWLYECQLQGRSSAKKTEIGFLNQAKRRNK